MNFLTNKHLDRRTLLRGVGAAIALPALDAMFPALGAPVKQARRAGGGVRSQRHHHEGLEAGGRRHRTSPSRGF